MWYDTDVIQSSCTNSADSDTMTFPDVGLSVNNFIFCITKCSASFGCLCLFGFICLVWVFLRFGWCGFFFNNGMHILVAKSEYSEINGALLFENMDADEIR